MTKSVKRTNEVVGSVMVRILIFVSSKRTRTQTPCRKINEGIFGESSSIIETYANGFKI